MRYLLSIAGVLIVITMAVIMPSAISEYQDGKFINHTTAESMERLNIITESETFDLIDRIEFLSSFRDTIKGEAISITKGNRFDQETVYVHLQEELMKLMETGALSKEMIDPENVKWDVFPMLFTNVDDVSQSIIFWEISCWSEMSEITMVMDDETGKILTITIVAAKEIFLEGDFEQLVISFAHYLDLSFEEMAVSLPVIDEKMVVIQEMGGSTAMGRLNGGSKAVDYWFGMLPDRLFYGLIGTDQVLDHILSSSVFIDAAVNENDTTLMGESW